MCKMKLLLKIMYNGRDFMGYQYQPDVRTVQGTLTSAVSSCFGREMKITGCSRTDAGVHALGFCCTAEPAGEYADGWLRIPVGKVHRALSRFLPEDIAVAGESEAADNFHPRYSVVSKEYIYRMYDTVGTDPFLNGRAWHLKHPVTSEGLVRMNEGARALIGSHDFTSFMASGSKIEDARRTIESLSVTRDGSMLTLRVRADGFLYNMVRIITGTLADCAYGTIDPAELGRILEKRDRCAAGKTAPADGLYLNDVTYGFPIDWKLY